MKPECRGDEEFRLFRGAATEGDPASSGSDLIGNRRGVSVLQYKIGRILQNNLKKDKNPKKIKKFIFLEKSMNKYFEKRLTKLDFCDKLYHV